MTFPPLQLSFLAFAFGFSSLLEESPLKGLSNPIALVLVVEPEDVLMLVKESLIACELVLGQMTFVLIKFTIRNGNERSRSRLMGPAWVLQA